MGRRPIGEVPMTPAERQRRRRAMLREVIHPEDVLADVRKKLHRCGFAPEGRQIIEGLAALIVEWRRQHKRGQFIVPRPGAATARKRSVPQGRHR
jgi:hypothetical protein